MVEWEWQLRRRAEEVVRREVTAAGAGALEQELRIHEVELGMQNDELRRTNAELIEARDAYRELYEDAPVGYLSLDDRGLILEANRAAATMLGLAGGNVRAVPLATLLARVDADALYVHLCDVRDTSAHRTCELDLEPPGRPRLRLQLDTVAALPGAARGASFRTTLTDVTERHRLQAALVELNRDLEQRVGERTAELRAAHERLTVARKMEAIGRLAGGVAHDFNNLLTVIMLEISRLRAHRADPASDDDALRAIERAAALASALTAKLGAFARGDSTTPEPCHAARAAAEAGTLLRALMPRNIELELRIEPDAGSVSVDGARLRQILVNLVTNARDAISGPGHIVVEVYRRRVDELDAAGLRDGRAGDYVVLAVRDDGSGMPREVMDHVFEPFFTTKGRQIGTGFGLATVFGVVAHAAGFIDLESDVGRGTFARVYLPRIEAPTPPAEAAPVAVAAPAGRTILLVDDDALVRRATCRVLEQAGYTVVGVGGGRAALAALAATGHRVVLVLTDVMMPGMTGPQLAAAIAATGRTLPVVLMSGFMFDESRAGLPFIEKPFESHVLLDLVASVLAGTPAAASSATRSDTPG